MTLMGTSASSGTVRGYFPAHAARRLPNGGPIYDGFLLTSTNGNEPLPIVDVPIVQMPTQTEVTTWAEAGIKYRRPDSDAPGNRYRLYEVAGMPHNNSRENPGLPERSVHAAGHRLPGGRVHRAGAELSRGLDRQGHDAAARAADRGRSEHGGRRLVPGARRVRQRQGRHPQRVRGRAGGRQRRDGEGEDHRAGSAVPARRHQGAARRRSSSSASTRARTTT